jgi:hypothetical protein
MFAVINSFELCFFEIRDANPLRNYSAEFSSLLIEPTFEKLGKKERVK